MLNGILKIVFLDRVTIEKFGTYPIFNMHFRGKRGIDNIRRERFFTCS